MTSNRRFPSFATRSLPWRGALLGFALAVGALTAFCSPDAILAAPPEIPRLPETDRIRLAEAFGLAAEVEEAVWPGWSEAPFAVLLVTAEHEFLVRHPAPSDDFVALGEDPLLGHPVHVRARQYAPGLLATFPAVGGVPTVVIGHAEATGKSSSEWVITVLHEHFHQLQMSRPGYFSGVEGLDLAGGDETGMWMLDYPYPYDSEEGARRFGEYRDALVAGLAAAGGPGQEPARAAVSVARARLRAAVRPEDDRYFDFQLWQEGVARYVEYRVAEEAAARREPLAAFRALADFTSYGETAARLRERFEAELAGLDLTVARRVAFYPLGALEALLRDAVRPGWKERYFSEPFALPAFDRPEPLSAALHLARVGGDLWRAEYTFSRPVGGLLLGPEAAGYRGTAWTILTPGVRLVTEEGEERLEVVGEPVRELAIEVATFTDRPAGNYMPMARFTDGGRAVLLDFFTGRALAARQPEAVEWRFVLSGLPGERALLPGKLDADVPTFPYAYFGPREPLVAGAARLLADPGVPGWLRALFDDVVPVVSRLYTQRFGIDLAPPLVWVAAGELDTVEGYSVKGGALGDQIYLELRGRELRAESVAGRRMFEKLLAHELAHLWQEATLGRGFNMDEPWIHEGSADAMAVAALVAIGLWSAEDAARFADEARETCTTSLGAGTLPEAFARGDWGAAYACGYGMTTGDGRRDIFAVWSALAAEARQHDGVYDQATLDAALAEIAAP